MTLNHLAEIQHGRKKICIYSSCFNDHIFQKIFKSRDFYEANFLHYLHAVVRQPGAIIDAGANIGNHSLFFSLIMGRETFSFEPNPAAYDALQKNLRTNKSTAQCFRLGLADVAGHAEIISNGMIEKNIGMAKLGGPTEKRLIRHLSQSTIFSRNMNQPQSRQSRLMLKGMKKEYCEEQKKPLNNIVLRFLQKLKIRGHSKQSPT